MASGIPAAGAIAYCTGNVYFARKDFDNAQKHFRAAQKEGFSHPDLQLKLADIYVATKQFNEKTLVTLEAAAAQRGNDATFVEGLCRAYLAARRSDDVARNAAAQLLAQSAENPVALRLAAKCDLKSGQAESAAEFARRALAVTPLDEEARLILTQAWQMAGRNDDEAVAVYKAAIAKMDDSEIGLLRSTALLLIDRGLKDDETYTIVQRAAAGNPQDGELLEGLAALAALRNDAATVQICAEALIHMGRRSPELVKQLADAYVTLNVSSDLAENVFREALKSETDQPDYQLGLATCLVTSGRTDPEAIVSLEKAFSRFNTRFDIGMQLTRAYLQNQRFDDAQKVTRYLLQHRKDDAELQRLSAQASLFSNRIEEAIKQYEHLAKMNPDDREAAVNLARAYAEKQRTDEGAAAVYQRALDFAPGTTTVRILYARHHAEFGRAGAAVEQLRLARSSDPNAVRAVEAELMGLIAATPDRIELRWMLADDLIEQGNLRDAVEHLTSIFEIEPSQIKVVLQALDRVLAKDANNLAANVQKGVLLKAEGRYEESRAFLERAFRMNANHGNTAAELEELYEQMLSESDDVAVRFDLGKLNYTRGDYDKAVGHFQKTSQDFRYENESIKMLGLCFVGKGMLEFALQEFRKLVIDDEVKAILYDLAQRYEAKNDVVGAKQVYRMLFAADITYRDVKTKFEMLSGSTSDPLALESSAVMTQLSEKAQRRYTLNRELGRGAMGIVYEAQDNELDELVALKILPDSLSQSPEAIQRFRSEARSARRLAHPNIVRIHDIGEEMGRKYISMEYVRGDDVKRIIKSGGRLPQKDVVSIVSQVADALNYAHSMNIVHRDIKPANIMLDESKRVKVSDFGIAKMLESTSETMVGAIMGTPLYMSPEQIMGEPVDRRADIYSLGIMFYELLSGKPPFTGGDLSHQHLNVVPKDIEGIVPELNAVVMKCLAKAKEDRYDTSGEIKTALDDLARAGKI